MILLRRLSVVPNDVRERNSGQCLRFADLSGVYEKKDNIAELIEYCQKPNEYAAVARFFS